MAKKNKKSLTKEEMGKINFFINNVNDVEKLPNGFKASIEDVKISIFPIFYIEVVEGSYKQRQEITEEEYNSIKNIFLDKIVADENKIYNGIKKALEESVAKKIRNKNKTKTFIKYKNTTFCGVFIVDKFCFCDILI